MPFEPRKLAEALRYLADGLDLLAQAGAEISLPSSETLVAEASKEKEGNKAFPSSTASEAPKPQVEEVGGPKETKAEEVKVTEVFPRPDEVLEETKKEATTTVRLPELQDLAAVLLADGHRRVLKTILEEVGVKSLSTADPSFYAELKTKLQEAVDGANLS